MLAFLTIYSDLMKHIQKSVYLFLLACSSASCEDPVDKISGLKIARPNDNESVIADGTAVRTLATLENAPEDVEITYSCDVGYFSYEGVNATKVTTHGKNKELLYHPGRRPLQFVHLNATAGTNDATREILLKESTPNTITLTPSSTRLDTNAEKPITIGIRLIRDSGYVSDRFPVKVVQLDGPALVHPDLIYVDSEFTTISVIPSEFKVRGRSSLQFKAGDVTKTLTLTTE
jgi:hypothetical protein